MGGLLALLSALGFASHSIFTRKGLMEENPGNNAWEIRLVINFAALSVFLGGIIIASFFGFNTAQEFKQLSFIAILLLVIQGILGAFLGAFFVTSAISQIGATHATALRGGANPLFATGFAIILLGESPGLFDIIFVLMVVSGILIIGYREHPGTIVLLEKTRIAGGIYALIGGFVFGLAHVIRGIALKSGATPNTAFFVGMVTALIGTMIACYIKSGNFKLPTYINRKSLSFYSFGGICVFVGEYTLYFAFALIPVWQAVAIRNIESILVIFLTWIFLKKTEKINFRLAIGVFLVTLGVVLINMNVR